MDELGVSVRHLTLAWTDDEAQDVQQSVLEEQIVRVTTIQPLQRCPQSSFITLGAACAP